MHEKFSNFFLIFFPKGKTGNPKRHRTHFTKEQILGLEKAFSSGPYIDPVKREQLANELGLRDRKVTVWFQNKRVAVKEKEKAKQARSAQVAPPIAPVAPTAQKPKAEIISNVIIQPATAPKRKFEILSDIIIRHGSSKLV